MISSLKNYRSQADRRRSPLVAAMNEAEDEPHQPFNTNTDQGPQRNMLIDRMLQRSAPTGRLAGNNSQQRCQRCWKVFHVGPLADRSSHICWRCEYAICPSCRVGDAGGSWKCCSCVKPMSLMRLFETTKSGRNMVVRVMQFCDPRAERILKSFFRFASLYALSSNATAGLLDHKAQLRAGVSNHIRSHLEAVHRESPVPSSAYGGSTSVSLSQLSPSRSCLDGTVPALGGISPNTYSGRQKPSPSRLQGAVGGANHSVSSERILVSESTQRGSALYEVAEIGRPTTVVPPPSQRDTQQGSLSGPSYERTSSGRVLFPPEGAKDEEEEPSAEGAQQQPELEAGAEEARTRSESPSPRFPNFSAFLEEQTKLQTQPQQQQQYCQVVPSHYASVSVSTDSSPSVVELGKPLISTAPQSAATAARDSNGSSHKVSQPPTPHTAKSSSRTARTTHPASPVPEGMAVKQAASSAAGSKAVAFSSSDKRQPAGPQPGERRQHAALVRTDSVLQAFERIASGLAEQSQQTQQQQSHPVKLAGAQSTAAARASKPSYPSPRAMQDSSLYRTAVSSSAPQQSKSITLRQKPAAAAPTSPATTPRSRVGLTSTTPTATTSSAATRGIASRQGIAQRPMNRSSIYAVSPSSRPSNANVRSSGYGQQKTTKAARLAPPTSSSAAPVTSVSHTTVAPLVAADTPILLVRQASSHSTYVRIPSANALAAAAAANPNNTSNTTAGTSGTAPASEPTTMVPLNRQDTAIPSQLKRSLSNPSGGFTRTASQHVDPFTILNAAPAVVLQTRGYSSDQRSPRETQPARHTTPISHRATTPLQRQNTQVNRPEPSDTFARIPTTKNFERLCSLNRPAETHPNPAIVALAGTTGSGASPLASSSTSALRRQELRSPRARTPRSFLLGSPATSPSPRAANSTSPRPLLSASAGTPSPAPHRYGATPSPGKSVSRPVSPSTLPPRVSPSPAATTTPQRTTTTTTAAKASQRVSTAASPSTKAPRVTIQTVTLSPRSTNVRGGRTISPSSTAASSRGRIDARAPQRRL